MDATSRVTLQTMLMQLVIAVGAGEAKVITAEAQRRMGKGGTVREWLRVIGDVIAERSPELAAVWNTRATLRLRVSERGIGAAAYRYALVRVEASRMDDRADRLLERGIDLLPAASQPRKERTGPITGVIPRELIGDETDGLVHAYLNDVLRLLAGQPAWEVLTQRLNAPIGRAERVRQAIAVLRTL
jgi:hypothetical protein